MELQVLAYSSIPPTTIINYPVPTSPPSLLSLLGFSSERIYQALVQNAAARLRVEQDSSASSLMAYRLALLDTTTSTSNTSMNYGFLTNSLISLTTPIPILLSVILILSALIFLFFGSRSFIIGSHWGRKRGYSSGDAYLSGGIGGLIVGGLGFGTLSTLLILLGVSRETNPNLGKWDVFAIVFSTALLGIGLAGKFKWVARTILGLLSGLTFTLLILASVPMITLLSRLIILAIFVPLSLLLSLLPKTRPHFTNFATSLIGAYFLLLGIDLFVRLGFSDLISGLVSDEGVKIDGTTEWIWVQGRNGEWKGLVAVWYILTILGTFVQIYTGGVNSGEDDETWNAYLASLLSTNPSSRGTFTPSQSFFFRIFSRNRRRTPFTDIPGSFPLDTTRSRKSRKNASPWDDSEAEEVRGGGGGGKVNVWDSDWDDDEATLNGAGFSSSPAKYESHKYDEVDAERDEAEEDEDDDEKSLFSQKRQPQVVRVTSFDEENSSVDDRWKLTKENHHERNSDASDSLMRTTSVDDYETAQETSNPKRAHFIDSPPPSSPRDHHPSSKSSSSQPPAPSFSTSNTSPRIDSADLPQNIVPATPSLISALKRVSDAQKQARSGQDISGERKFVSRKSVEVERKGSTGSIRKWEGFWEEVVNKSSSGSDKK